MPTRLVIDGLRKYEQTGELPDNPRVHQFVVQIVEFLKSTNATMMAGDEL